MWNERFAQYKENRAKRSRGMADRRLPRSFFARDGLTVAQELLGKVLVHEKLCSEGGRQSSGILRMVPVNCISPWRFPKWIMI